MHNFSFHNPTRIHFGTDEIEKIGAEIPPQAKVLVTLGGGSARQSGLLDKVLAQLGTRSHALFEGIEPNPTYETLMQAVERVRNQGFDFLLAVGGGSVIDGTKFIAAAALWDGDPWDILLRRGSGVTRALPFGSVLTLPATGSEMNSGSVVTLKASQDKLFFGSAVTYPQFSILDPRVTYSLPPRQVGNGIVDAYVHVCEQYLTENVAADVQDRFAEGLLLTLISNGPRALADPQNYDLRANLMWAATLALNGLIGAGQTHDWATHMIGHELTALFGLDHAQTLAIVLPGTLSVRAKAKRVKLLQYADRVFGIRDGDEDARIRTAIEATRGFFESVGVKTRLGDYGIGEDAIPRVIAQLERHRMTRLGERGEIDLGVAEAILRKVL